MCQLNCHLIKGLGWRDGASEVAKTSEGPHLARWGHIEPRTAVVDGFRVPEQVRAFIRCENLPRTHRVPSGHLGSGTNNYGMLSHPKPFNLCGSGTDLPVPR
jgi:hypothetical protein